VGPGVKPASKALGAKIHAPLSHGAVQTANLACSAALASSGSLRTGASQRKKRNMALIVGAADRQPSFLPPPGCTAQRDEVIGQALVGARGCLSSSRVLITAVHRQGFVR